ncbi:MAG: magnesium chelatase subunit H [Archaeoglobaceae archaeon]|nr:magnesium chelatase subunit H [Archaeoglobaceae archaeon]MDW8118410.1 magnesium chelatase subunit H [Archaeoglobaceae archaeon]
MKILLVSTIANKSLKSAIESVRDFCEIELVYSYELHKFTKENLQKLVDDSDLILLDVRGDPGLLKEIDFGDKDVIVLVGGSTLMSKAKLGKFRMPARVISEVSKPETIKRRIEIIQKTIETLGKILPFGTFKDAKDYVKTLRYWANAGFENYRNMFLHLCKVKGFDLMVEEPSEFPDYGFYHPKFGFNFKPKYDPKKPSVGILFYGGMHFENCLKTLELLLEKFSSYNVFPVFSEGILNLKALEMLFEVCEVDAIISMLWFQLNGGPMGGDPRKTIEMLKNRKTKLFTPAMMFNQKLDNWKKDERGLNPINLLCSVTLPEIDGAVEPLPICGVENEEVVPILERVEKFAERVKKWVELKRKSNEDKRIAFVIYNYPPGEENLGKSAYFDTFKSLEVILKDLKNRGYFVNEVEVEKLLLSKNLFNPKYLPEKMIECPRMSVSDYLSFFNELAENLRKEVIDAFGEPPGDLMVDEEGILIPAVNIGNVAIVVQPVRRDLKWDEIHSTVHDKTKPPHHQYLATYFWIQKVFRADAVIHLGTHGTAEFMKGKEAGLSSNCYPDLLIGTLPNIYVYHVVNTSEATIAKRRLYSTLISYNSPPYTFSGLYEDYLKLEDLIEEFREALGKDPARAEAVKRKAIEVAKKLNLGENLEEIELKLYEFKRSIIPKGLHVLGEKYSEKELKEFMLAISIRKISKMLAEKRGEIFEELDLRKRKLLEKEAEKIVEEFFSGKCRREFREILENNFEISKRFIDNSLEIENLIQALDGRYIEPSTGGDVIRNPEALPTGRNIYQFDPLKVPTEGAVERGKRIAEETLRRFYEKNHRYPESIAVVLWGFETAQSYGETVAQIFEYLGVEIVHKTPWEKELRIKSLEELKRPRIDVIVTICGFFRDMFPNVVELIDKTIKIVSELNEPENMNFVKKHAKEVGTTLRIFGPRSTEYGTRMIQLVEDSAWNSEEDLADAYLSSMCFAYGKEFHGFKAKEEFRSLLKTVELISQVRSSNDYEITDLDHYYEFFGGISKTVELLKGKKPEMLIADSTKDDVKVESIGEAIERGSVTRNLNPLWIEEMLKHGFLGVQKIADRVENLLGLSATTGSVENWIWDKVAERFVLDEKMFRRLKELNTYATLEILERLLEAEKRGYWKASDEVKKEIEEKFLDLDGILEEVIK